VIAVFAVFALLYWHAYRKREALALDAHEALETRLAVVDNAGLASIGVLSLLIATLGGTRIASLVAGPIYFLIGPFKFWLGSYTHREHRRLEAQELTPAATPQSD
jgi:hypothetical protein